MLTTLLVVINLTLLLVLMTTLPRYLHILRLDLVYNTHLVVASSVYILIIQVWDYQTKSCVQTLEGHTHNVSAVCFHPELPIIMTGSEDGTVRIWHSTTYR